MTAPLHERDELLTPSEVAALLYVDPKTVARWAHMGKIPSIRTPGGHRRYLKSAVDELMAGLHPDQVARAAQGSSGVAMPRQAGNGVDVPAQALDRDAAAAAVVADAVAIALEAAAAEAAEAVVLTQAAVSQAAERAAEAAEAARGARAAAAAAAADMAARDAERTATRA